MGPLEMSRHLENWHAPQIVLVWGPRSGLKANCLPTSRAQIVSGKATTSSAGLIIERLLQIFWTAHSPLDPATGSLDPLGFARGYGRSHSSGCFYAIAPTSHPMHAVIAIARPPQNATRIAPLITLASPARAASPPISARTVCDDRETNGINCAFGAITSDHEWHQRTESKAACSGKGCLQWARAKLLGDQPQARSCGRDRWSPGRPALLLAEIEDEDCWRQLAVASVLVNGPIREHA
jgi:hypothetical protein